MKRLELSGADLELYANACKQRLEEIAAQRKALKEEEQHLLAQLKRIEGGEDGPEPGTWREKLNAFATKRNKPFTYHQAADYLLKQGWHNNLSEEKLRGSVAATLARLTSNGDYRKTVLENGTNYGLPEWFEGDTLKKDNT